MDDAEILGLYRQRSELALLETKEKCEALGMTIAYNMLGSREDAEECMNDVLLRLWRSIPPAEPESLGAFLVTAVRNAARNRLAYQKTQRRGGGQLTAAIDELAECIASPDNPECIVDSIALRDAFRAFLPTLKQPARVIFLQRYWLCLTAKEIASETGHSVGYVNMSLLRTKKKLKAFLEKEELL